MLTNSPGILGKVFRFVGRAQKGVFLRSATGVGGLKALSLGLGFITSAILARALGAEEYGTYAFVTSVMAILGLPLYAGMPALLVRETARICVSSEWGLLLGMRRRMLQWIAIGSVLIAGLVTIYLVAGLPVRAGVSGYLLLALPLLPLMALNQTRAAILRGFRKVVLSQIPGAVVQPLTHMCFMLVFISVAHVMHVQVALISLMSATFVAFVVGQAYLGRELRVLPDSVPQFRTREWLGSIAPFTMVAAINLVNGQLSTVLLGSISSLDQVAYLRVADRMSQLVSLSLVVVNMVAAPQLAQLAKAGDKEAIGKVATHAVRLALFFALPVALVLVTFGKPLVSLGFGSAYAGPVWLPLSILSAGQLVNVYFGSVGTVLNMSGYERDTLKGISLGFATNAAIAIVLIPRFGAIGGAIGASLGMATWNFYLYRCVRRRLGISITPIRG